MKIDVCTEDLPAAERFAYWLEMVRRATAPHDIRSAHADAFLATLRTAEMGSIQVNWLAQQSLESHRTARHIRQSDPEHYQLGVVTQGRVEMEQSRRSVVLGPGDVVLQDTSRPFHTITHPADGLGGGLMVEFPRVLLPLPEKKVTDLLTVRMPGQAGLGRLVTRHLMHLVNDPEPYGPSDAARIGAVTVDLVTALLAHVLDDSAALPQQAGRQALLAQVQTFIEEHLGDPALTPQMIATAHHLSVRSLHRLFEAHESTVTGLIRARRLDRCRHDLVDLRLRHRSIHAIATRWGFAGPSQFSRVFRNAHGLSPQDYRQKARELDTPAPPSTVLHSATGLPAR